jgi:hypothetical protein
MTDSVEDALVKQMTCQMFKNMEKSREILSLTWKNIKVQKFFMVIL